MVVVIWVNILCIVNVSIVCVFNGFVSAETAETVIKVKIKNISKLLNFNVNTYFYFYKTTKSLIVLYFNLKRIKRRLKS